MTMIATRAEGLARLNRFLPLAGRLYAANRNHDLPGHPHVSGLSPWLRHRLVTEAEVLDALQGHPDAAKFRAEVLWRTYWKGWLERRPAVWAAYRQGLSQAQDRLAVEAGLRADWKSACLGQTGIDGFDTWARELAETGYLHNHARMWFASIWIFTLRLPWELGADFFLRHLIDGDPASNTLSWRWVGGLHTPGKIYLATADNIARHTGGRFSPKGLALTADPLRFDGHPGPGPVPEGGRALPGLRTLLLLTEEDCTPEHLLDGHRPDAVAVLSAAEGRSPLAVSQGVLDFTAHALDDALGRVNAPGAPRFGAGDPEALADHAAALGVAQVVTPHAPVGPVASALAVLERRLTDRGIDLVRLLRDHDRRLWPHATHGFFRFHEAVG